MNIYASQTITIVRDQVDSDGLPSASTHTATLWKNGAATAETVTSGNPSTGSYSFAFTIPSDAVADDIFSLRVVDGDGFAATVWEGCIARAAVLDSAALATLANQEEILSRLSQVTITTSGFGLINPDGTLLLKRGHTVTVTFTSSTSDVVPDLSAANTKVFFGIRDVAGRQWLSVEGTVVTATGLQSVSFIIPAAKAASMRDGIGLFDVIAVYGYTAGNPADYTALHPFASGNVQVHDLSLDLTNI